MVPLKVAQSGSEKTSYIVVGQGAGDRKLSKVRESLEKDLAHFIVPTEHSQRCPPMPKKGWYTDTKANLTKQFLIIETAH